MRRQRHFCLIGLCVFVLRAAAAPWSGVTSDLPPDPSVRWGTLANGLRYAVMPNAEPKGRVSLRLLVAAGSLHESDDEQGLAHFIEHMAFRGTKAYPRGALVPALEHAGIALGPDNTAFTTNSFTIYHLELPDGHEPTLRLGLGVFREYAGAISFDPDLIEIERGVILSEKDSRNTPDARVSQANQELLWPGSRLVRRPPIGKEDNIRHFTREQFAAFYDAWYRPERMAVVMVGDVTTDDGARLIAEIFSPLQARAPARPEPDDLVTAAASRPNIVVYGDPGWAGVTFALEHASRPAETADTHARRMETLHRTLAFAMLQKRLEEATHQVLGNYVAPIVSFTSAQPPWQLSSITVSGNFQNWKSLAAEIEQQHRRAFQYGFTHEELRQALVQQAAIFDNAVRTAGTRASPDLAAALCGVLLYGGVMSTPADVQRDLAPDLTATTVDDCLAGFRGAWGNTAPHVFLAVNSQAAIARSDLLGVLNQSRQVAVSRPEERDRLVFAYTDFGPPGALRRESHVADLDVHLGEFANGVQLNFKSTAFEADSVIFRLRLGGGRLTEPPGLIGLRLFANSALMSGGLGRHSVDDLNALMAGHNLAVNFGVEDDAFVFSGRCSRSELPFCLQLVTAYITDAAFNPGMIRQVRASLGSIYASVATSPGGPIQATAEGILTGDQQFGLPGPDDALTRDFGELSHWLEPQFKQGPIELDVVGDIPWEEVRDATGRTLGALPDRPVRTVLRGGTVHFGQVGAQSRTFFTGSTVTQSTVAFFWPAPGVADAKQDRRCVMAATVVGERIRERLREDLGATYTPVAQFVRHETYPDFGYFFVVADVSPADARQAAGIIGNEITRLRTEGIGTDLFDRVRQPYLRSRADDLRNNSYWLYSVLTDAQCDSSHFAAARNRADDNAAITRDDINALIRRYLGPEKTNVFDTYPAAYARAISPESARSPADTSNAQAADVNPVSAPLAVRQDPPAYPRALRAKRLAGAVTVQFVVGRNGKVKNVQVLSSPDPLLSQAAEKAVAKWEFTPGEKDGQKVETPMQVDVAFDPDMP